MKDRFKTKLQMNELPARARKLTNVELKNIFGGNDCCKKVDKVCGHPLDIWGCCEGLICAGNGSNNEKICKKA